jgi:hypothetical protein
VQSREFRNIAFKWLEQLRKESVHVLLLDAPMRRSYFDECRGERYEQILCSFSSMVLEAIHDRHLKTSCPPFLQANEVRKMLSADRDQRVKAEKFALRLLQARFGRIVHQSSKEEAEWRTTATRLSEEHSNLFKQKVLK